MNIKIKDRGPYSFKKGISLLEISKEIYGDSYKEYLGARINNQVYNLHKEIEEDMKVEFLDNRSIDGYRIYAKTITAIFIMACKELYEDIGIKINHFLGPGLYVELIDNTIKHSELKKIEEKMKEICQKDYPIVRKSYEKEEALKLFEKYKYFEKIRLFKTIDKDKVDIYEIHNHIYSFHGYLAPSTSFIDEFRLKYYYPGALILFPSKRNDYNMDNFVEQKKLGKIFEESARWLDILDLAFLGSLNEKIISGEISEVIKISEALHEKKIAEFADKICADDDNKIILISGPSSSGKTTFAQRLSIQLKVNGKEPIAISLDDYFVDRDKTPLNPDGSPDFEALEAVDLDRLNEDLLKLIEGETIELPRFNFKSGRGEKSGKFIRVGENQPILIEGIHGLNPELTREIPEKNKFKIYISALTQLNLDAHNRISTTDIRLVRRMVRDVKYRGNNPLRTFELWQGVRKGEEKNIFPYQEEADVILNTSLVYEMSVLKKYIVPLLEEIERSSIYYSESRKLLRFLEYFLDIEDETMIPTNSILREFIGGASFDVH